ncbi:hypothetical protein GCM10023174_11850 [Chelativorans composti]
MQIDDAVDALVRVLKRDELLQGPEIVAQMQVACRLHPRENELLELTHPLLPIIRSVNAQSPVRNIRALMYEPERLIKPCDAAGSA